MFIQVSEFKAKCLGMIDAIRASGETVIITKHGKPVAKLVPYTPSDGLFGCMQGQIQWLDNIENELEDAWIHWNEERNL